MRGPFKADEACAKYDGRRHFPGVVMYWRGRSKKEPTNGSTTVERNTILLGALLTILGAGTFAMMGFEPAKVTALLPAFFGVVFLLLGLLALKKPAWHKPLVLAAVVLALLAFVGTAPGLARALWLLAGGAVARRAAAVEQAITAVLCLGYVGRALKAFLAARRVGQSA